MIREFKAKIIYKILPSHPNKDFVFGGWEPGKEFEFEDTYRFDTDLFEDDKENMYEYMKSDLSLVAGGGYNRDHIYGERFFINGKEIY